MDKVEQAYQEALQVLRGCASPLGLKASSLGSGYPQVWARDAPITALGALMTGDEELIQAVRVSLETLGAHQSALGMIPLNVDTRTGEVTTENAGAIDANMWFVLGHFAYHQTTGDAAFLRAAWPRLQAALTWLAYQDMNGCGLLEAPEAADWADLYSTRYNTLYANALYVGTLEAAAQLSAALDSASGEGQQLREQAADVRRKINLLLWLDRPWNGHEFGQQLEELRAMRLEWFFLYQNTATLTEKPFYLSWAGFREFGNTFDGFGNMLAILFGVADSEQTSSILDYAHAAGTDDPAPLKAFFPPIYPGERDWREHFRSRNLNLPDQYHNGGIWPFLGGFYVLTLQQVGMRGRAEEALHSLALANEKGRTRPWEFNEWLHGRSGRPMGHPLQAWSAGMYVCAYQAVRLGKIPALPLNLHSTQLGGQIPSFEP
ncbi:glycogen debranching protein [Deinococcus psychrotolerans]|uniref:beta-fructofuranosidase n=1 Tax=Deinococcus psychrotolerans TaxID=2489213 RepID=A0A3G8YHA6_9DEIO|nr:glycoside hydrolase 100 family protein [Deinococcus psychrotolerans]AZI44373.1 glycogen debranching protein [Deinococcus psychrotolerans]